MTDIPFGLARQGTYANLGSHELETMGRQASTEYLASGTPLNDAIVKIAREHPSISAHQIQRIVEFANTETFSCLFEKQAGDKNVEFPVADPAEVLHRLNDGSRPQLYRATPDDYSRSPVKTASVDVEADIALCKVFGFEPTTPALTKSAEVAPVVSIADRIMGKEAGAWTTLGKGLQAAGGALKSGFTKGGPGFVDAAKGAGSHAWEGLKGSLKEPNGWTVGAALGGAGVLGASKLLSKNSSVDEALMYAKTASSKALMVIEDLSKSVSVDAVKEATAIQLYPDSNPYGNLIRAKQKLASIKEEAWFAYDKNSELLAESEEHLKHAAKQYMFDDGNLGTIAHVMKTVQPEYVKEAMTVIMPDLKRNGLDSVKSLAAMIEYEMVKGASNRTVNPDSDLVQAYSTFCKLASGQDVLRTAAENIQSAFDQVDCVLKQAMVQNATKQSYR
jgi:hypothetical protein